MRTPEPQPEWGPARSRTVQWSSSRTAAEGAGRSGLEFMQALADGKIPPPPIAMLFGMWPTRVERGLAQFECVPDESAYNPIGVVHGGLVCTLADSVAGCAVHTTLDAGIGYTSIDITVNYLRPVTSDSGTLVAVGRHPARPPGGAGHRRDPRRRRAARRHGQQQLPGLRAVTDGG